MVNLIPCTDLYKEKIFTVMCHAIQWKGNQSEQYIIYNNDAHREYYKAMMLGAWENSA